MNWGGAVIGTVIGMVLAVGVSVGLQLAIWGNNAPDWYAAPAVLIGLAFGTAGSQIGLRWRP